MAKRVEKLNIEGLSYGEINSIAQDRDWSEGYGETPGWDYIAASRCEKCGEVVLGVTEGDYPTHKEVVESNTRDNPDDGECTCEGNVSGASPPMMNSLWPCTRLHMSNEDAAKAIVDLPLCVVVDGDGEMIGLALTGGGMDLSWEIAEAYIRLGCYPPATLRLPAMCGRGTSAKDKAIAKAMVKSYECQIGQAQRGIDDVKRTLAFGRKYERENRARREKRG